MLNCFLLKQAYGLNKTTMKNIIQASKFIGAGLATISLAGSGVGIGIVFAALMQNSH